MQNPIVVTSKDNLNERNAEFSQAELSCNFFLNSVPKSGSHLLKNIIRMFVPVSQQYDADFIQHPNLEQHHKALISQHCKLSWGHLLFSDTAAVLLKNTRHVLLVRDPYDWVLARCRFFLSDNFKGGLEHLKHGRCSIEDFMNMMIFGVHTRFPTMQDIYLHNAVAWLGTSAHIVKYEDIIKHLKNLESKAAEHFFKNLLAIADIDLPHDWKARVLIGSDRRQSGTARENLELKGQIIPKTLPSTQRHLVDYTNPGLRSLLGYN